MFDGVGEIRRPCHPVSSREHCRVTARSGSQRTTALAAPPRHDGAAGTGPHTQPEAVDPGPATVVRLEGALALGHRCFPRPLAVTGHNDLCIPVSGLPRFQSSLPNRRGPGGPVAAVSPTFGRLFEGTEVTCAGQTAPIHPPRRRPPTLLANCWQRGGNLLASGRAPTPAEPRRRLCAN